jgi:hypothetical protein
MRTFDLIFSLVMILAPAVLAACIRTPAGVEVDRSRVRRLSIALWGATAAALALLAVASLWPWTSRVAWVLFFPLFGLSLSLIAVRNPDWVAHRSGQATRSASLVSRRHVRPIPRAAWVAAWAFWAVCTAAIAVRWLTAQEAPAMGWWTVAMMVAGSGICLPLAQWAVARTLVEPEPMDPAGSPDLAAAYDRHRTFRAWGFYGMFGVAMPAVFVLLGVLLAWLPREAMPGPAAGATLGILGGVLGTALGLAGAAFGTLASVRRARIAALHRQLETRQGLGAAKS